MPLRAVYTSNFGQTFGQILDKCDQIFVQNAKFLFKYYYLSILRILDKDLVTFVQDLSKSVSKSLSKIRSINAA